MKIVKLYTAEDNKSYFEEIEVPTNIREELGNYSETNHVDRSL